MSFNIFLPSFSWGFEALASYNTRVAKATEPQLKLGRKANMSMSKKKLPLKPKELKAVKEFQEQVAKKFGGQILAMKLYGSKARVDSGKYSYIDILSLIFSQREFEHHKQPQTPLSFNLKREAVSLL